MKVGRNGACPCGSGKKYKKCCPGKFEAPVVSRLAVAGEAPTADETNRLIALFNAGNDAEVENQARLLIERAPDSGFAWKALGISLQMQGKEALPALLRAAELAADDAELLGNLGGALQAHKRLDEAVTTYRKALEINPGNAAVNSNLGVALQDLGRHDEAVIAYRRALAINPGYTKAHSNLGNALKALGQNEDAVASYRRGLAIQPDDADVLNNLGLAQQALGQLDLAVASYQLALAVSPDFADAHNNLGNALQALGRFDDAAASCRRALTIRPTYARAHNNLGVALQALGQLPNAVMSYERALENNPSDADVHNNLGQAHQALGNLDLAVACYDRALVIRPDFADTHYNLGVAQQALHQLDKAVASFTRATEIRPDYAEAHNNLGLALASLLQLHGAVTSFGLALKTKPEYAEAHNNLGMAQQALGNLQAAVMCFGQALEIRPDLIEAQNNLGLAQISLGHLEDAVTCFGRALESKPDYAEAHSNLAIALQGLGRLNEAVASCHRALEIRPDFAKAHSNLGQALQALGQHESALASFRQALEVKPDFAEVHSNLLFVLSHSQTVDAQTLFAEHCRFGEQFEAPLRSAWPQHTNSRQPQRRLQVGFVSGDLHNHAVASFIEPVLAHISNSPTLALHAYYNNNINDDVTQRLRSHFKSWHPVMSLSDETLAQKIQEDGIDILIDLAGHTAHNRLLTFARKPAPVQVSWIGYPGTTGLQSMDYYFSDLFFLPPGQFDSQFTERLSYLSSNICFQPYRDSPSVNALPALSNGFITFGSFNRANKISQSVVKLWSQLLRALPNSRMVIGGLPKCGHNATLVEWFAQEGIDSRRLSLHAACPMPAYLALHHQVDICLDTFPYNGGTTTLHALWMGVPTLTLSGSTPAGRTGPGILRHVGLSEFAAADKDAFLQMGLLWASNLDELNDIRVGLRERFTGSDLGQPAELAAALGRTLRDMWQRWCSALPAYSGEEVEVETAKDVASPSDQTGQLVDFFNAGRYGELEGLTRPLLDRCPDSGLAWKFLGVSLQLQQKDGLPALQRAAQLLPEEAGSHNNLGGALQAVGRLDEAVASYRQALEINPDFPEALNNLGGALQALGQLDEAVASYRRALDIYPGNVNVHNSLIYLLSHSHTVDAQTLFAEHCRFGEQFEAPLRSAWPQHTNSRQPQRRLQVGFVSGDLHNHAVASFIEPVLAHISNSPTLALHAYYNNNINDDVTQRLRSHFKSWHPVMSLSDETLAQKIQEDGIDILIDLAGHTAHNRLLTFARKPAPVQVSWIGYPGTTGLQSMDYYLADRFSLPSGQFDDQFTEKIVHVPASAPFMPSEDAPSVNALPALGNGYVTFGSFSRRVKISRTVIGVWASILRALPDARMVVAGLPVCAQCGALIEWFAQEGIAPARLSFHMRGDMEAYLGLHHEIDVCLDTFPYSGGTTTLHALWMGVPTLTLTGGTAAGRTGAGILGQVGLEAFVAHDQEDFVQKALFWSGNLAVLAAIRAGLRERFAQSAAGQPAVAASGIERTLRTMWQRWCGGLPPIAFEVYRQDAKVAETGVRE